MTESIPSRSHLSLKTLTPFSTGRLVSACLVICVLASGCSSQLPSTRVSPTGDSKQTETSIELPNGNVSKGSSPRVERLLHDAEQAISQQKLTTPVDDNAYLRFLQVLAEEPTNTRAVDGLNRIVETYVEWSIKAVQAGNFSKATSMLNKARSVDDHHPSIVALEQRIARTMNQQRDQHHLSKRDLRDRTAKLTQQLQTLARYAENNAAKIKIIASSDSDGRWIYQQMNTATHNRIRANLELGPDPVVQLIFP